MIIKSIKVDSEEYIVKIQYAKVKGIITRINPKGEICVKSNKRYELNYIMNYLNSIESWLRLNLKKVNNSIAQLAINECLRHEKIWLRGKLFQIQSNKIDNSFFFDDNVITVNQDLMVENKYLKVIRCQFNNDLSNKFYKIHQEMYGTKVKPSLEFKCFSSRWGVCYPKREKIVLNERLCHLPDDLIILIMVHELVHLKVFNHSKTFYQELSRFIPNYKILQKKLKKYSFFLLKEY